MCVLAHAPYVYSTLLACPGWPFNMRLVIKEVQIAIMALGILLMFFTVLTFCFVEKYNIFIYIK